MVAQYDFIVAVALKPIAVYGRTDLASQRLGTYKNCFNLPLIWWFRFFREHSRKNVCERKNKRKMGLENGGK